jgi:predicted nicotinamide N-methyase
VATHSPADLRAFVRRHTSPAGIPDVPGLRLSLASDVTTLWRAAGRELGQEDPPLPFWGFAWAGGLAVARHLLDHPDEVAGRRVIDVATGSGMLAILAADLGAASIHAFDVDPLSQAAVAVNAKLAGVRVGFSLRDPTASPPPECDVILAGDVCYEEVMAERIVRWLRRAAASGTRVLVGDPGRLYLPAGLERLATYRVNTTRELERSETTESAVYTIRS